MFSTFSEILAIYSLVLMLFSSFVLFKIFHFFKILWNRYFITCLLLQRLIIAWKRFYYFCLFKVYFPYEMKKHILIPFLFTTFQVKEEIYFKALIPMIYYSLVVPTKWLALT